MTRVGSLRVDARPERFGRSLIGAKIRERRKENGLTQTGLAATVGISASYLNLIEANRRHVGGALLKRIADALALPIDHFDAAPERRLIAELGLIAVDPVLAPLSLPPAATAALATQNAGWALALVRLHRAWHDSSQAAAALADRFNQDPLIGGAVHSLLTHVSAIRSASEILESNEPLDAEQRQRFISIIAADSRRLSDVSQTLAGLFTQAQTTMRSLTPADEVDDFLVERENHFPVLEEAAAGLRARAGVRGGPVESGLAELLSQTHGPLVTEAAATGLRRAAPLPAARRDREQRTLDFVEAASGPTRRFRLARQLAERTCAEAIAAELEASATLVSAEAKRRAGKALSSYVAGAVLMPYDAFHDAAEAARYDIDHLGRAFGASFEQVCHRLVTLRRPGAEGIRFGFLRSDPAGHVTKRFALPSLPLPRSGTACPLWAVYMAFQTPGATVRQLAEFPSGDRYLMLARAVDKERSDYGMPRHLASIMLMCDGVHAGDLVYGDGLDLSGTARYTPVGQTCRVCVRRDCRWRQEDPIVDTLAPGLAAPPPA